MPITKATGVGSFAGRFHLNESGKRIRYADGVVRTRLQITERRFSDRDYASPSKPTEFREVTQKYLQRSTELILWFPTRSDITELSFGGGAES
jgi:hypothetical protein